MHRAIPVTSKILEEKWNRIQHEKLQQRIQESRALFSASGTRGGGVTVPATPNSLSHFKVIINRAKRDQIQEDRYTEIEKENRRLLQKMTGMLKGRRQQSYGLNQRWLTRQNMDASTLTSEQISRIFSASPRDSVVDHKKSLNRDHRKRELQRISQENHAFLQRLQFTQPAIQTKKIEEDYIKKIPTLKNMCEKPYVLSQNSNQKRQHSFNNSSESDPFSFKSIQLSHFSHVGVVQQWSTHSSARNSERQSFDFNSFLGSSKNQTPINNVPRFDRPSVVNTIRSPIAVDQREAEGLDQNRIVHFKKGKYLNGGYFIIEISTSTSNLFIAAFDVESPASFLITIPFPKAQDIIEMFEHNFEMMSEYLYFSRSKLVMLNPIQVKKRQEGLSGVGTPMTSEANKSGGGGPFSIGKRVQSSFNNNNNFASTFDQTGGTFSHPVKKEEMVVMHQERTAPWSQQNNQRSPPIEQAKHRQNHTNIMSADGIGHQGNGQAITIKDQFEIKEEQEKQEKQKKKRYNGDEDDGMMTTIEVAPQSTIRDVSPNLAQTPNHRHGDSEAYKESIDTN